MQVKIVTRAPIVLFLLALACGRSPSDAQLDGHYEDATAASSQVYRGQQVVQPEYADNDAVIVSSALIDSFGREDIVKAIVDAGAKRVYMTSSRGAGLTLQSASLSKLRQMLGSQINKVSLVEQADSGYVTVWARDWSPLGAVSSNNKLHLLDLNYYPRRPADDATSRSLAGFTGLTRVSVPVYNEGGNFMINGRGECLMTTRVTDANQDVFKNGDMILDASAIKSYYGDFAGCRETHIFPRMPTETTGHIDMWAKFLNDDTVIVGEIGDETLAYAQGSSRGLAMTIQEYLNDRAEDLTQLGYRVVRIPMPVPATRLFRSYTNSLLMNGTAIVPQYRNGSGVSYQDQALLTSYENRVKQIYQEAGFKVVFIPSDQLIASGGAVHCVTMQLPAAL